MSDEQQAFEEAYQRIYGVSDMDLERDRYYPERYTSPITRDRYRHWRMTVAAVRWAMREEASNPDFKTT